MKAHHRAIWAEPTGPVVRVRLAPLAGSRRILQSRARDETDQELFVLVDTGASSTCIDDYVLRSLRFAPQRHEWVVGIEARPIHCPVYLLAIGLDMSADGGGSVGTRWFSTDVLGIPRGPQEYSGLLGRDFLGHFEVHFHGPFSEVEIRADVD